MPGAGCGCGRSAGCGGIWTSARSAGWRRASSPRSTPASPRCCRSRSSAGSPPDTRSRLPESWREAPSEPPVRGPRRRRPEGLVRGLRRWRGRLRGARCPGQGRNRRGGRRRGGGRARLGPGGRRQPPARGETGRQAPGRGARGALADASGAHTAEARASPAAARSAGCHATDAHADSDTHPDAHAHTDPDPHPHADAHTAPEAHTHAHPDPDSDASRADAEGLPGQRDGLHASRRPHRARGGAR